MASDLRRSELAGTETPQQHLHLAVGHIVKLIFRPHFAQQSVAARLLPSQQSHKRDTETLSIPSQIHTVPKQRKLKSAASVKRNTVAADLKLLGHFLRVGVVNHHVVGVDPLVQSVLLLISAKL
jgi:hypothetical protein